MKDPNPAALQALGMGTARRAKVGSPGAVTLTPSELWAPRCRQNRSAVLSGQR